MGTVDAFQGAEKDIVIVSCVRTAGTGFIEAAQRINVALTRARHHLFMIGERREGEKERIYIDIYVDMYMCIHFFLPSLRQSNNTVEQ